MEIKEASSYHRKYIHKLLTLKGAALGGSVGMILGGPVGTVIGSIVGATIGKVVSTVVKREAPAAGGGVEVN